MRVLGSEIDVTIDHWAAWAPGLESRRDWLDWAAGNKCIATDDVVPEVTFVKPMVRRRLSRLTKMSLRVAHACETRDETAAPEEKTFYVFCSQLGEYARTINLLQALSRDEPLAPAAFSHSVHNTSAGIYSIINENKSSFATVASGPATLEAGFVDAWTALQSGAYDRALVVYHDEPLDPRYAELNQTPYVPVAAAFSLRRAGEKTRYGLKWSATGAGRNSDGSEHSVLKLLRLVMDREHIATVETPRLTWEWRRHGQT